MFCCLFREEFIMLVIHLEAQFIMQDGQDESPVSSLGLHVTSLINVATQQHTCDSVAEL
jgi:hypothetical protein